MEAQEIHERVKEAYWEINNKWMLFHLQLLALYLLVVSVLEIVTFFIIQRNDMLTYSVGRYWLTYIITPICLILLIAIVGNLILKNRKISMPLKQYIISFSFGFAAFVLCIMHSGFVAVLVSAIFPVMMTVMYENQKLTMASATFCLAMQFISGYFPCLDPLKKVDNAYLINMLILATATFCTWLTCYFMIKFMKMKREIVINNDIERHQLQEKVNIDGLTNVGNKLALMKHLEEASQGLHKIYYLAMLDIDKFKKINDTYGHVFGDDVLKCIGDGMRKIQAKANAFRYGGDEFCISFDEQSLEVVINEIERVQEHLRLNIKTPIDNDSVFISVGIARYHSEITFTALLQKADGALYESKQKPDGRITVYSEERG